jgi:hypothetical protein
VHPRYIALIVFVWVTAAIFGAALEGNFVGAEEHTTLEKVMFWEKIRTSESGWSIQTFASAPASFLEGLWDMVTFNFAYLKDTWWLRWMILAPLVAFLIWGLALTFLSILQKGI